MHVVGMRIIGGGLRVPVGVRGEKMNMHHRIILIAGSENKHARSLSSLVETDFGFEG